MVDRLVKILSNGRQKLRRGIWKRPNDSFWDIVLPQVVLDADRLESWLIDCKHKEELSTRYIQRHSPIRDKKRIDHALEELESLNRIKLIQEGKRKLIKVNPIVLQ